jgi:hypothetical protein
VGQPSLIGESNQGRGVAMSDRFKGGVIDLDETGLGDIYGT